MKKLKLIESYVRLTKLFIYPFIKTLFKSKISHATGKNMYRVNHKDNTSNTLPSTLHKSLTLGS